METKHTPGPWHDRHFNANGQITISALGYQNHHNEPMIKIYPAHVPDPDRPGCLHCPHEKVDEACANARLIAAAPDLLAACQAMIFEFSELSYSEGYTAALDRFCKAKRAARVAIAKATGEDL